MSRAEEITSEVRKLVLTCRSMQAQLEQSIPKKNHQEIVAKMQATIDGLNAELERTKNDLAKTTTVDECLNSLAARISAYGEQVEEQRRTIESLTAKLAESTVPTGMYAEATARNHELETRISQMVERADYDLLSKNFNEAQERIATMVPRADYDALSAQIATMVPAAQFNEMSASFASLKEQYAALEARASSLEARLADSVPRTDFDELTARIAQLTMEATQLAVGTVIPQQVDFAASAPRAPVEECAPTTQEAAQSAPQPIETPPVSEVVAQAPPVVEAAHVEIAPAEQTPTVAPQAAPEVPTVTEASAPIETPTVTAEATSTLQTEAQTPSVVEASSVSAPPGPAPVEAPAEVIAPATAEPVATIETPVVVEETVQAKAPEPQQAPVAEIREVQSQLSEIQGATNAGEQTISTEINQHSIDPSRGFRFTNTEFYATSVMDFLQDLEKAPAGAIEYHTRNGDFERWFQDVVTDSECAESLKSIREAGSFSGEELRIRTIQVIAPRYRAN